MVIQPRMKFWVTPLVLAVAALGACRKDRVDVRDLTPEHRSLFAEAAAIEGVDTTIHGRPGDWTVKYDFRMFKQGNSKQDDLPFNLYCKIRINPDRVRTCGTGSTDHHFRIIVRHELRHCDGREHSSDPKSLMYYYPPCWPID